VPSAFCKHGRIKSTCKTPHTALHRQAAPGSSPPAASRVRFTPSFKLALLCHSFSRW
jgi:hypothetical protein